MGVIRYGVYGCWAELAIDVRQTISFVNFIKLIIKLIIKHMFPRFTSLTPSTPYTP